ncbi:hypothetical protein BSLG_005606 [Batrachochytrium salamandrivorans]|nr:hypothetical protein BSLG_005606 [Batrachochytrium salamandrivorans]
MVQSGFDTVPTPTFRVSSTQPLASDSDGVTTVGPAQTSSKSGSKNSSNGGSAINVSTETSRVPASNSSAANNSSTINSSQLEPNSVSTTYSGSTLIPFTKPASHCSATAAVAGDSSGGDGTATMAAIDATHDDGANGAGDAMASTSSRSAAANAPFEFKNVGSNSAVPTAAAGIFAAVAALGKKKRRAPEDTTSDLQPRYRVNSKAAGTSAASFNSNYPVAVLLRNE